MIRKPVIPRLSLDTKTDILFQELNVVIHQPSIEEISLIGENTYDIGITSLTRDYVSELKIEDNSNSSNLSSPFSAENPFK